MVVVTSRVQANPILRAKENCGEDPRWLENIPITGITLTRLLDFVECNILLFVELHSNDSCFGSLGYYHLLLGRIGCWLPLPLLATFAVLPCGFIR